MNESQYWELSGWLQDQIKVINQFIEETDYINLIYLREETSKALEELNRQVYGA